MAGIRAGGPLIALAVAALAFDADPRVPWTAGVAGAVLFLAAAVVRTLEAELGIHRARRSADRLIVANGRVAWRERELTATRTREGLRREIDRLLRSASAARLPSSSPLNRPAVRRNAELLRSLGERRPLSARGVLLTQQLLRDPRSPVYSDQANLLLPRALVRILGETDE